MIPKTQTCPQDKKVNRALRTAKTSAQQAHKRKSTSGNTHATECKIQ